MPIIQTTKELRKRDPKDHYPTPYELCEAVVSILPEFDTLQTVLDPGAGAGPWGEAVRNRWSNSYIVGVEMDDQRFPNKPESYDAWFSQNYLDFQAGLMYEQYNIIIGNPPYGVGADGKKDRKLAEKFVAHSWKLLKPYGHIVFLLRTAFSCGQGRMKTFYPKYPLKDKYDLSRRPSFTGNHKTDSTDYAIFVWQKGYRENTYTGHWLEWNYKDEVR